MPAKPRVPWYWWPIWMIALGGALLVFYGLFTPAWIGIRVAARLSERRSRKKGRG